MKQARRRTEMGSRDSQATGLLRRREVWLSVALALITAIAYAGVLANGFVNLDDDYHVYRNVWAQIGLRWPAVKWAFTTMDFGNWQPLTWLSLELDNQLFGLNPAGYHATNLLIHIANTLALFWLLRAMTGAAGRSACVAAFFALHPLHVESVAWITERKDVLSALFFLLSLLSWQIYARRSAAWAYWLAVALLALSLMAKVMGVSLPLVLLLLDVWPLGRWPEDTGDGRSKRVALVAEKLPLFLLIAVFAAIAVVAQKRTGAMEYGLSLSFINRLALAPVNYVSYLAKTFWPVDLAVLYPHPGADLPLWKPLGAVLLLALITAAVVGLRKSRPYLLVGWCWFLVTLLPVIGLVQLGVQATADRYMYLPMVGLLIMLCWGVSELAGSRRWLRPIMSIAGAACLFVCGILTARQVAVWHDSGTLWEHALAVTRPTFISCNGYGLALQEKGRLDEAERWYRKALEIEPLNFYPNCNLGILLSKKGKQQEAAQHLEIALRSQPDNPLLLENLGVVEELQGHYDAAIEYYESSAQLDPRSPRILQHLKRVRQLKAEAGPSDASRK